MSEANLLFEVLKQCNPFHRFFPFRSLKHMNTSLSSDEHSPDPPPTTSCRFPSEKGKTKTPFKPTIRNERRNNLQLHQLQQANAIKMAPRSTGFAIRRFWICQFSSSSPRFRTFPYFFLFFYLNLVRSI